MNFCSNCRWWDLEFDRTRAHEAYARMKRTSGQCRRNAPITTHDEPGWPVWPYTRSADGCRQFEQWDDPTTLGTMDDRWAPDVRQGDNDS